MKKKNWRPFLFPLIIMAVNALVCLPWFKPGFTPIGWSMEPALLGQARFIRNNWPNIAWYPYWYLGFPFKLAGSPVLPYLLALINFLIPKLSLAFAYRLIAGLALISLPFSFYLFTQSLLVSSQDFKVKGGLKKTGEAILDFRNPKVASLIGTLFFSLLPSSLFLFPQVFKIGRQFGFFPWQFISLAILGNGQKIFGLALIPVCLLIINLFLKGKIKRIFWPILSVFILALVDFSSLVSLLILWSLLLISYLMVGRLSQKLKKSLRVLVLSLGALSFYYTPRFWWQVFSAPSLAGQRTLSVVLLLGRLLSVLLPMVLAVISARFLKKRHQISFIFSFLWVLVFVFLTASRFLADTDFWQDYTSWGVELGMGISLLLMQLLTGFRSQISDLKSQNYSLKLKTFYLNLILIIVIFGSTLLWFGNREQLLKAQENLTTNLENQLIGQLVKNMASNERVFLSGTPVFWLNSLVDIAQVRGGTDKAATHPFWAPVAYQIRVGDDSQLAWEWLKALGVNWILVHGQASAEHYHDFVNPDKFKNDNYFKKVWESKDDFLYQVKGIGIARAVDNAENFLNLKPPKDGSDVKALITYNAFLNDLILFKWINSQEFIVKPASKITSIDLAISFDRQWQVIQGKETLQIKKDALGQLVIFPKNSEVINVKYTGINLDQLIGYIVSLFSCLWIFRKK